MTVTSTLLITPRTVTLWGRLVPFLSVLVIVELMKMFEVLGWLVRYDKALENMKHVAILI